MPWNAEGTVLPVATIEFEEVSPWMLPNSGVCRRDSVLCAM